MDKSNPSLFLGYPCSDTTSLHNYAPYLQVLHDGGFVYLGKFVEGAIDSDALTLLATNIISILKKESTSFTYDPDALVLIGVR